MVIRNAMRKICPARFRPSELDGIDGIMTRGRRCSLSTSALGICILVWHGKCSSPMPSPTYAAYAAYTEHGPSLERGLTAGAPSA